MEHEHKRLENEAVDHGASSPDDVWNELTPWEVPLDAWSSPPKMPPPKRRDSANAQTLEAEPAVPQTRPDAALMKLARTRRAGPPSPLTRLRARAELARCVQVNNMGVFLRFDPKATEKQRGACGGRAHARLTRCRSPER